MHDLEGKTALVTGAARGLGLAISELFAERGAQVMLTDIDAEAVEAAPAGSVTRRAACAAT